MVDGNTEHTEWVFGDDSPITEACPEAPSVTVDELYNVAPSAADSVAWQVVTKDEALRGLALNLPTVLCDTMLVYLLGD